MCPNPERFIRHICTMARLHAGNRYDRQTNGVEQIIGRPASAVAGVGRKSPDLFTG
jgi:NAD(P)H dehydrogenase (quinone)